MTLNLEQWQYPIGRYQAKQDFSSEEIKASIATLEAFPTDLKELLSHIEAIERSEKEGQPFDELPTPTGVKRLQKMQSPSIGNLHFVSFGHDGIRKPETLSMDDFVYTARNFLNNPTFLFSCSAISSSP